LLKQLFDKLKKAHLFGIQLDETTGVGGGGAAAPPKGLVWSKSGNIS